MYDFSLVLLYLAFYSFLGWIAEVLFVFVTTRHLQNRGFLTGPFVPIYGFGALALIYLVSPYVTNPFLVFVASVVVSSLLEYLTHLALDKIFHIKLWDYSDKRFNLHGRICLENSLLFGMLGLLLLYVLHPFFTSLVGRIPHEIAIAVAFTLVGILVVDAGNSFRSLAKVRPVLDELHGTLAEAHNRAEQRANELHADIELRREAGDAAHRSTLGRLARAFPHARSTKKTGT
jgi:uncharacterized membrane protein